MSAEVVGRIAEIWRHPVKSLLGQRLEHAQPTETGVPTRRPSSSSPPRASAPGRSPQVGGATVTTPGAVEVGNPVRIEALNK